MSKHSAQESERLEPVENVQGFIPGYGYAPPPVPVQVHVVNQEQAGRQSRDKAQYVRQQRGHSLTLHLLLGMFVLWIPAIYISVSPNHYWHA